MKGQFNSPSWLLRPPHPSEALPTHCLHKVVKQPPPSSLSSPVSSCSRPVSLSLALHTSKRVSLSLWGIETVNAWGFDVPLLCEPSQSSACACLPSLHHLIILCGGEGQRDYETLFHSSSTRIHLPLLGAEFPFLTNALGNTVLIVRL